MPGMRVEKRKEPSPVVVCVRLPIGPVIVTWASGTIAFVESKTKPLRFPRADPWSWASAESEQIPQSTRTNKVTSHLFFIALKLLSGTSWNWDVDRGLQT